MFTRNGIVLLLASLLASTPSLQAQPPKAFRANLGKVIERLPLPPGPVLTAVQGASYLPIPLPPGEPRNGFSGQVSMVKVGQNLFTVNIATEVSVLDLGSMALMELAPAAPGKTSTGFCAGKEAVVVPSFNLGSDNVASDYSLTIIPTDGRAWQFVDPVVHASRCALLPGGNILAWFTTSGGPSLLKIARLKPGSDGVYRVEKTWATDASGITDGLCLVSSNTCFFAQAFSKGSGQITVLDGDTLSTFPLPLVPGHLQLDPTGSKLYVSQTTGPMYDPAAPRYVIVDVLSKQVTPRYDYPINIIAFSGSNSDYLYDVAGSGLTTLDLFQGVGPSNGLDAPGVGISVVGINSDGTDKLAILMGDRLELISRDPPNRLVNAASFGRGAIASGSWSTLLGARFTTKTSVASGANTGPVFPVSLGGVQVTINGLPAPLLYVSPGQVNFQWPAEIVGTADVRVRTEDGRSLLVQQANAKEIVPALFLYDGQPIVQHASDWSLATATNPAHSGEVVTLYANGGLCTTSPVATNFASPLDQLLRCKEKVQAVIGGIIVEPQFAGRVPGTIGLFQINVQIPGAAADQSLILQVQTPDGMASSASYTIPIVH